MQREVTMMSRAVVIEDGLSNVSPLEMAKALNELELYDQNEAMKVIEEVYQKYDTGEHLTENVIKPVIQSVADGLFENWSLGRKLRKKGLTATRLYEECWNFTYDTESDNAVVNGYTEYKNMRDETGYDANWTTSHKKDKNGKSYSENYGGKEEYQNPDMTRVYVRMQVEDKKKMNSYKERQFDGKDTTKDEYEFVDELVKGSNTQTDHIIAGKKTYDQFSKNPALNEADLKSSINEDENFALTYGPLNNRKGDDLNENVKHLHKEELPYNVRETMKRKSEEAQSYVNAAINESALKTLLGKGNVELFNVDRDKVLKNAQEQEKLFEQENNRKPKSEEKQKILVREFKKEKGRIGVEFNQTINKKFEKQLLLFEQKYGRKPDKEERKKLREDIKTEEEARLTKKLQKQKAINTYKNLGKAAGKQTLDLVIGDVLFVFLKPVTYELKDLCANGLMTKDLQAEDKVQAIKIRFNRALAYAWKYLKKVFVENIWETIKDFIKTFLSTLVEAIINCFVGIFKTFLKLLKEAAKILIKARKIMIGEEGKALTDRQKRDTIIKFIGASVAALAGIGIELLLMNKGIPNDYVIPLSTILGGVISVAFMWVLNKSGLFSCELKKRRSTVIKIFDTRIAEINEAAKAMDTMAITVLAKQRECYNKISAAMKQAVDTESYAELNEQIFLMAKLFKIELPYSSTEEFVKHYDSVNELALE